MIVVTAPTGAIGRQVLANLLSSNETVRVIARQPSRLPAHFRERVEVVQGSHGDFDVVDRAFAGADAVFWLVPLNPRSISLASAFLDFTRPACAACSQHGVQRMVGISALGRGYPGPAGLVSASLAMDDLIATAGVAYRALTMPAFMDNMFMHARPIREQGMFCSPIAADLKLPTIATRDIAAVAAQLLLDRSWTGVASVPLLGPEDLSFDDIAHIVSDVLGKPVRYQQVPAAVFKVTITSSGLSEAMAQGMIDMMLAKNNGLDQMVPRTPESSTPTSFRRWCEEEFKPAILA